MVECYPQETEQVIDGKHQPGFVAEQAARLGKNKSEIMVEKLRKSKVICGSLLAERICALEDEQRKIPSKIKDLFALISAKLGGEGGGTDAFDLGTHN